jgi:hypothetical protein
MSVNLLETSSVWLIQATSDRDLTSRAIEAALIAKRIAKPIPRRSRCDDIGEFNPNPGMRISMALEPGAASGPRRLFMSTTLPAVIEPQNRCGSIAKPFMKSKTGFRRSSIGCVQPNHVPDPRLSFAMCLHGNVYNIAHIFDAARSASKNRIRDCNDPRAANRRARMTGGMRLNRQYCQITEQY